MTKSHCSRPQLSPALINPSKSSKRAPTIYQKVKVDINAQILASCKPTPASKVWRQSYNCVKSSGLCLYILAWTMKHRRGFATVIKYLHSPFHVEDFCNCLTMCAIWLWLLTKFSTDAINPRAHVGATVAPGGQSKLRSSCSEVATAASSASSIPSTVSDSLIVNWIPK